VGQDKKKCVIPECGDGEKAHSEPDAPSCSPWWPPVSLWAIGEINSLNKLYEEYDTEDDEEKRLEVNARFGKALIQLVNGTTGGSKGMRSHDRNMLYVPFSHAKYYDTGYNWVIIPIMSIEEMKGWKGERYDVAIFTGESDISMKGIKNDPYNFFQDGESEYTACEAEKALLGNSLAASPGEIRLCSKEEITKVTELIGCFLRALADLHTRSGSTADELPESVSISSIDPREWSIIDLLPTIRSSLNKGDPLKKNDDSNKGDAVKKKDTKLRNTEESAKGIDNIIQRLNTQGVLVPIDPQKDTFDGRHVFKTTISQSVPPDPILLGAKSSTNLSRQWGMRLLPGCGEESESSSSSSLCGDGIDDLSYVSPVPMTNVTGLDIRFVSPESKYRSAEYGDDANESYVGDDDISEVSILGFDLED